MDSVDDFGGLRFIKSKQSEFEGIKKSWNNQRAILIVSSIWMKDILIEFERGDKFIIEIQVKKDLE